MMVFEIIRRESVYLMYYLSLQTRLIAPYWAIGTVAGSAVSVFGKRRISASLESLRDLRLGILGIIPASLIGIASPLCMYGTIPLAASFSEKGVRDDWLAAFMMSSILLNPQLLAYSAVLGRTLFVLRFAAAFLGGLLAGLLVRLFSKNGNFFLVYLNGGMRESGCRSGSLRQVSMEHLEEY